MFHYALTIHSHRHPDKSRLKSLTVHVQALKGYNTRFGVISGVSSALTTLNLLHQRYQHKNGKSDHVNR